MSATLLLVHGAWHGSWCWSSLVPELDGLDVRTVDLPSSGADPAALGGLDDDVAVVRAALDGIDGPVVVAAHSYGGIPVAEAVTADDDAQHLVYVCAFMLDAGESLLAAIGGEAPPWWDERGDSIAVRTPLDIFYADVDPAVAADGVARLGLQSRQSFAQPLTRAAWHDVPSTYVVCAQDAAIPPPAQEAMSQRAGRVERLDASHSPFLSQPAALAAILRDRAG